MSSEGHEGQERNTDGSAVPPIVRRAPTEATQPDDRLRDLGVQLARLLHDGRGTTRPRTASLRTLSRTIAIAADDDHEIHRVLVDVSVAAQHLGRDGTLGAYARSRRRMLEGGPAVALLDGVLRGIERTPGP